MQFTHQPAYDLDFTTPMSLGKVRESLREIEEHHGLWGSTSVSFTPNGYGWDFLVEKRANRRITIIIEGSLLAIDDYSTKVIGTATSTPWGKINVGLFYGGLVAGLMIGISGSLAALAGANSWGICGVGLVVSVVMLINLGMYWSDRQGLLRKIYTTLSQPISDHDIPMPGKRKIHDESF